MNEKRSAAASFIYGMDLKAQNDSGRERWENFVVDKF